MLWDDVRISVRLFDKESQALYMPDFASNLLSVKRCATDLQCNVIFSPDDVKFQDIKSSKLIGKGVTKGELYLLVIFLVVLSR